MRWRYAGSDVNVAAAAMRLCWDLGRPDQTDQGKQLTQLTLETAVEEELAHTLQRLRSSVGFLDKVLLSDVSVRLQARSPILTT